MKKTNTNTRERRQVAGRFGGKQDAKIGRVKARLCSRIALSGRLTFQVVATKTIAI